MTTTTKTRVLWSLWLVFGALLYGVIGYVSGAVFMIAWSTVSLVFGVHKIQHSIDVDDSVTTAMAVLMELTCANLGFAISTLIK